MSQDGMHQKSATLISATLVPVESMLYFYGNISRETAEWILWDRGCQDGMYLVRESSGDYVLSLCFQKSILHYRVKRLPGGDVGLCGVPHQLFPGPVELVEGVEGLACKPTIPCNKSLDAILPLTHWGLTQDEVRQAIIRKGQEWGLNEAELMLSMSEEHNDVKHLIIKTLHEIQPWFHGHLSREQAEKALLESGLRDGKFLVRERNDSSYAFCLSHCGKIKHYKIDVLPSGEFAIQDGQRFPSIIALVSHYSLFSDGLWCALTEPCDNRITSHSFTQANHLNKHQNLPSSPNPESSDIQTSNSSSNSSIHSSSSSNIQIDLRAKNVEGRSSPSSPAGSLLNSPFSSGKSKSNSQAIAGANQKGIFTKLIYTVSGLENQGTSFVSSPFKVINASTSNSSPCALDDEVATCSPSTKVHQSSASITLTPQKRKTSCSFSSHSVKEEEPQGSRRHSGPGNAKVMQKASSFDLIPAFISALFSGNETKECSKMKKRVPSGLSNTCEPTFETNSLSSERRSEFYISTPNNVIERSKEVFGSPNLCNNNSSKMVHYANKDILNGTGRSLSLGETNSCVFENAKDNDSLIFIRSASSPSVVSQGVRHNAVLQCEHIQQTTSKIMTSDNVETESSDQKCCIISPTSTVKELSSTSCNSSPKDNSQQPVGSEECIHSSTLRENDVTEQDLMYFDLDEDENNDKGCEKSMPTEVIDLLLLGNDYLSDITDNSKPKEKFPKVAFSESSDQLDVYATLTGDSNTLQGTLKRNKLDTHEFDIPKDSPHQDFLCGSFLSQEDSELAYQTLRRHRRGPVSLDPSAIVLNDKIGSGNFGEVWCGSFKSGSLEVLFAVKMLKSSASHQKIEILSEAHTMAALDHPHIVRLIGVCDSDPFMLVMELAPLGPLNKYLKSHRETVLSSILTLMVQVSSAMEFLESEQFVHRDLAARNVLLVNENFAKISDFGMSRALGFGKEYYRAETPGKWPLKWYAPECIYYFKFSTKSDIWSFGVTLWEAMSYGSKPYQGMSGGDILQMFDRNERLLKPKLCPDDVYEIMLKCWYYRPEDRPDFSLLHQLLKQCAASYKCR